MVTNNLQIYDPNARMLSHPYNCVQNEWYRAISHHVDKRGLLPILDNPEPEECIQFKSHSPMSKWEGLYSNLARVSAEYLKGCGVALPATTVSSKAFTLRALYLLETGAVVYQNSGGKDGIAVMICTKNIEFISNEFKLSPKRLAEFKRYCAENAEEVVSGKVKCVAFGLASDGFTKPYCRTISVNAKHSMLIPLMSVWQFVNLLLKKMRGEKAIRLTYNDRFNQRQEIVTSLNPRIVYNRFGNNIDPSTIGVLNPEIPAILLTLVDLQKRTIVDVPITQIIEAKQDT